VEERVRGGEDGRLFVERGGAAIRKTRSRVDSRPEEGSRYIM
jgi:hypothetical protein